MNAGDTIYTVRPSATCSGPGPGSACSACTRRAALAAGFVLIGRRDA